MSGFSSDETLTYTVSVYGKGKLAVRVALDTGKLPLTREKRVGYRVEWLHGQNLISRTRGSSEHNENFIKKCGISKIICDTACRAIYLNTRTRLILKG